MGIVLLVLFPTLGVVAMALFRAGESYREASSQRLLETAQMVAQSVDSELNATARLILGFAEIRRHDHPNDASTNTLQALSPFMGVGLDIYSVANDGSIKPDPGQDPEVVRVITEAASSGEIKLSNIVTAHETQKATMRLLAAVPDRMGVQAVEVAVLATSPSVMIQSLYRPNVSSSSAILAVVDGTGRIIGRTVDGERFIGRPVPDWERLVALGADNGVFRAKTLEGGEVVLGFQKISGTPNWFAVAGETAASFDGRWQQPIYVMLVASSITILVALALAIALVQRILQPVSRLARRARAVANSQNASSSKIVVDIPPSFVSEFETLRISLDEAEKVLQKTLLESQQAELLARESSEALRQAEKIARIGSWSLDLETNSFTSSDMLYELNRVDPNGPPLTVEGLSALLAPESYERVTKAINHCVATGESYWLEVEHLRDDGTSFPAYVRGGAIKDDTGRIIKLAGTVQDISESKEQSDRLVALADNLPSGVIFRLERTQERKYRVVYVSGGTERLTGIPAAQIMSNSDEVLRALHPEDRGGILAALKQSRKQGDILDCECRLITRDGRTIWAHYRAAVRNLGDGRTIWDGIARDITAEREAAEALRLAKEAAEAAERSKSDFLATMSHEIRTPMNTVIGMARLALQTSLDSKQRNYLEKINASAKVLLGIISDILDFSKIEAGGLELETSIFTIESILESVATVTVLKAEEKGLEIAFSVQSGTPTRFKGDALRLGQILTNLVGNAVKFTEHGDILVSIAPVTLPATLLSKAQAAENANRCLLQFSVRDTGVGLSEDQIKGLFRPFTQASIDTSRKYGGTGLGLAICKRLVEMMGGSIRVESQPGVGSTFIFTVALERVKEERLATALAEQSGGNLQNRRILIVDDNENARVALSEMVSNFGMITEAVSSGEEALNLLRTRATEGNSFDIVLLDWRMPGMDGLETARHIKSDLHLRKMPAVLMVTAYGHEIVIKAVEEIGLHGLLLKPVTQSVMFNTVLGILSNEMEIATAKEVPSAAMTQNEVTRALTGRRVLVVDDNALNREVASEFLSLVGVEVETAVDGLDALAKMEESDFDAVLMDMHMPNMNGLAAVEKIRTYEKWADLPVIALTAQARVEDRRASLEAGMTAHLTKPIDEATLYQTLMQVLDGSLPPTDPQGDGRNVTSSDIEMESLKQRFGGDRQRAERMVNSFLRDFSEAPRQFDALYQERALPQVAELVHQIKGAAGYFGVSDFCEIADMFERTIRRGDNAMADNLAPVFRAHLIECLDKLSRVLKD
ncbi:response regulator [Ferrovibrio sp.]|uniref:response regulator n=1 Tax=Ferrovibrio sp. TaxID=1917215 RepID=UPI0025BDFC76|nr:response regulator [Ferrovibrio sp.]MBX3456648.1 response regulator [Ferrovibrio sp.]